MFARDREFIIRPESLLRRTREVIRGPYRRFDWNQVFGEKHTGMKHIVRGFLMLADFIIQRCDSNNAATLTGHFMAGCSLNVSGVCRDSRWKIFLSIGLSVEVYRGINTCDERSIKVYRHIH